METHVRNTHVLECCSYTFETVAPYWSHRIQKHISILISTIDRSILEELYEKTRKNHVEIKWEPVISIMIMIDSQTHTNTLMKSWHDKDFREPYQQIPLYASLRDKIYHKYNKLAFVKQCVSDWNYSHEGPEMLRYALWVDKIIKFLTKFHSELPAKTYIPSEEIIVDRDYQGHCSSCKDDQDHRTSSQRCVSISSSSSVMYRLD